VGRSGVSRVGCGDGGDGAVGVFGEEGGMAAGRLGGDLLWGGLVAVGE